MTSKDERNLSALIDQDAANKKCKIITYEQKPNEISIIENLLGISNAEGGLIVLETFGAHASNG